MITAATVFVVDSAALFIFTYFQFSPSWWIAIPIFAINLPAMPVAIFYSAVLDETISKPTGVWLLANEVIVSSLVWGYVADKWIERKSRIWEETQGFPVITDDEKTK